MKRNYCVLDVETGGSDENQNAITQIGYQFYAWDTMNLLTEFEAFIKPYNEEHIYEQNALDYTNITMADINKGMLAKDVANKIVADCKQYKIGKYGWPTFVAHNADFDWRFISQFLLDHKKDIKKCVDKVQLCTQRLAVIKYDYVKPPRLGNLASDLGIQLVDSHSALADVAATADVLKILMGALKEQTVVNITKTGTENQFDRKDFKFNY